MPPTHHQLTPAQIAAERRAYLDQFRSLTPEARELALLEGKDGRWSGADRRRYSELMRMVRSDGED